MFEKEAEELIEESKRLNTTPRETVRKAIEFGFQKGIKAKINTTTISDCPIKDEWHYVKDGKYPKENQLVMVYRVNPLGANIAITNWYDSYKDTKVIAWKEIVPPKE